MRNLNNLEQQVVNTAVSIGLDVTVPPTYPDKMEILVVGEAGGKQEVDLGEGFVGKAGEILQKIISVSGIYWNRVGRSNVAKRAPEGGYDSEHFQSTFYETQFAETTKTLKRCNVVADGVLCNKTAKQHIAKKKFIQHTFAPQIITKVGKKGVIRPTQELNNWIEVLRYEIELTKPKVIIACGNEALKALCNVQGISKLRGSMLDCSLVPGVKVVPLIHPSWIARSVQYQEIFISSHIICSTVLPHIQNIPGRSYDKIIRPDIHQVTTFLRQIDSPYVIDIETRAGSVACIGFAAIIQNSTRSICVPIQTTTGPYFSIDDEVNFWQEFQAVALKHQMIGHNIFYDMAWLREYGITPIDVEDTMILFHRLFPELPKGLDFVNMWFSGRWIPYYKDDGKTWGRNQPDLKLWEYNTLDCVATLWAFLDMMRLVQTRQFRQPWINYQRYTRSQFPIAFEMQSIGMPTDEVGLMFAKGVLSAELDKVRQRLEVLSDGKLAIRDGNKKITDQQVAVYVYGDLKLPVKRNRKTKAVTADEDALVELLIQFPQHEVLKAINAERKISKALSSYINIRWREV
jgi:uracil-DNA glycosylase family 4